MWHHNIYALSHQSRLREWEAAKEGGSPCPGLQILGSCWTSASLLTGGCLVHAVQAPGMVTGPGWPACKCPVPAKGFCALSFLSPFFSFLATLQHMFLFSLNAHVAIIFAKSNFFRSYFAGKKSVQKIWFFNQFLVKYNFYHLQF